MIITALNTSDKTALQTSTGCCRPTQSHFDFVMQQMQYRSTSSAETAEGLRTYFFASCCACLSKRHNSSTKIKFWTSLPPPTQTAWHGTHSETTTHPSHPWWVHVTQETNKCIKGVLKCNSNWLCCPARMMLNTPCYP